MSGIGGIGKMQIFYNKYPADKRHTILAHQGREHIFIL